MKQAYSTFPSLNKTKLAMLYGVSEKTLNAWFEDEDFKEEFGKYRGKVFTPRQLEIIEKHFGPWGNGSGKKSIAV